MNLFLNSHAAQGQTFSFPPTTQEQASDLNYAIEEAMKEYENDTSVSFDKPYGKSAYDDYIFESMYVTPNARPGMLYPEMDGAKTIDLIFEKFIHFYRNLASTEKYYLYGFSWGGQFVARYMMLFPEKLFSVVVGAPASVLFPWMHVNYPSGLNCVYEDTREEITILHATYYQSRIEEGNEYIPNIFFGLNEQFNRPKGSSGWAHWLVGLCEDDFHGWWSKISCLLRLPVFLLAGTDDVGTKKTTLSLNDPHDPNLIFFDPHNDRSWQGDGPLICFTNFIGAMYDIDRFLKTKKIPEQYRRLVALNGNIGISAPERPDYRLPPYTALLDKEGAKIFAPYKFHEVTNRKISSIELVKGNVNNTKYHSISLENNESAAFSVINTDHKAITYKSNQLNIVSLPEDNVKGKSTLQPLLSYKPEIFEVFKYETYRHFTEPFRMRIIPLMYSGHKAQDAVDWLKENDWFHFKSAADRSYDATWAVYRGDPVE